MKMQINKIIKMAIFNLKFNRLQIIGWSLVLFLLSFVYMILFPNVKEIAQIKIENMPEEILELFNIDFLVSLSNFQGFLGVIYSMILIAIAIFAVTFSASLLTYEESNKTIEFLGTLEVSRIDIYLAKALASFLALSIVLLATDIGLIIPGFINGGETFNLLEILEILKFSNVTVYLFWAIGLMISGINGKKNSSIIGSLIVIIFYFVGYLGTLLGNSGEFLGYLSPFETLSPSKVLNLDFASSITLGIYCLVIYMAIFLGGCFYSRRDRKI